jgi:cytosol alanyl aminopeptidase
VTFQPSKPLPSYLVAIAVGPFDEVAIPARVPSKVLVPHGRGAEAGHFVELTPKSLAALEEWFGIPYPYEKLDLVVVPASLAAMENPGLITYPGALFLGANMATIAGQKRFSGTHTHEIAHSWFGDYVTLAWWDDIWLNEATADWIADKVLAASMPSRREEIPIRARERAMIADALSSARRVREPVVDMGSLDNVMDKIAYDKGSTLLRMIDAQVAPDEVRRRMRAYLEAHRWGSATSDDFFAAMPPEVAASSRTFLDQSGVPLVSIRCEGKTLHLAQERYRPVGSKAEDRLWDIPVCLRLDGKRRCERLAEATRDVALERCPAHIVVEPAYFRVDAPAILDGTARGEGGASLGERLAAISDAAALVRAGRLPVVKALGLVSILAHDPRREIVDASVDLFEAATAERVTAAARPGYQRWVASVYAARARQLSWKVGAGDDEDRRVLRARVLSIATLEGRDPTLRAEGVRLARLWLDKRDGLSPDLVGLALRLAAEDTGAALLEPLAAAARGSRDKSERIALYTAIGALQDPEATAKARALLLDTTLAIDEVRHILITQLADPRTRDGAWAWLGKEWDRWAARVPPHAQVTLANYGAASCDEGGREARKQFLVGKIGELAGAERRIAQADERVMLCAALRTAQEEEVKKFFVR